MANTFYISAGLPPIDNSSGGGTDNEFYISAGLTPDDLVVGGDTYYCREDGTASKANAIGPASTQSACMPLNTFNASTFSPGDEIVFTSRDGDFDTWTCTPQSSGTIANPIILSGEEGYLPNLKLGVTIDSLDYVTLNDLKSITASALASNFRWWGDCAGVVANNLVAEGAGQCIELGEAAGLQTEVIDAEFNNLTLTQGASADECFTIHSTNVVSVVNGGTFESSGADGCLNWVLTPSQTFNDVHFKATSSTAACVQPATAGGGVLNFNRCTLEEYPEANNMTWYQYYTSDTYISYVNCIFLNFGPGATYNYILVHPDIASFKLINCTFYDSANDYSNIIYNYTSIEERIFKNNIFVGSDSGEAFATASGTFDYNLFYVAGTARGTNTVTTDPVLAADGRLQSSGSSAVGAGIGPSSDSDIPTDDIDGDTRSGTTTDLGADLWVDGILAKDLADTITMSEDRLNLFGLNKADTITLSEDLANAFGLNKADTITLSEDLANAFGLNKADTITLTESISKLVGISQDDTITMSDNINAIITLILALNDTITMSDSVTTKAVGLTQDDTITMSDNISYISAFLRTLSDTVNISDDLTKTFGADFADTITMSDNFDALVALILALNDSITMSDSLTSKSIGLNKSDTISLSDDIIKAIGLTQADIITMSERFTTTADVIAALLDFVAENRVFNFTAENRNFNFNAKSRGSS